MGIAVIDLGTRCLRAANPAFAHRRGCMPGQLVGRPAETLFPAGEFARIEPLLAAAERTGHATFESAHACADGASFPVLLDVTVLAARGDVPATLVLQAIDISDLRRTEVQRDEAEARSRSLLDEALAGQERLQASERRFQDICNASADWVWEVDDWGRYQFVSEGVRDALGYEPSEVLGRTPFDLMPAEEAGRMRPVFAELAGRRAPFRNLENLHLRKDGEPRHVLTNGQPFFDRQGILRGYRGVNRDVTDARRAELALRESEARQRETLERRVAERTVELARANRAKSEFLASMSHELRTPLNAIIGLSEVLKEGVAGPLDPQQRRFAGDIWNAGRHLHDLINDILDLSKIEAGRLELEPIDTLVRDLLAEALFVVRERAASHGISLQVDCAPEVGRALFDVRKVKQIAYNLLSNAVKFTASGGTITLAARCCGRDGVRLRHDLPGRLLALPPDAAGPEFLEISVTDSGCGIDATHFDKLFEPFVQIKGEASRPLEGTGLGLSLVRRFAELHRGTVGVESVVGEGSRFVVWLPCRRAE